MPLNKSPSKAAVSQNIKKLVGEGRKPKQAVAIALNTQRRAGGGRSLSDLPRARPRKPSSGSTY